MRSSPWLAGCLAGLLGITGLLLFVVFWVKIANYSGQLALVDTGPRDWKEKLAAFDDDEYGPRAGAEEIPPPPPDAIKERDPGQYQ